jgi:hypothetical protein
VKTYSRPQAQRNQRRKQRKRYSARWAFAGAFIAALLDTPPLRITHVLSWAVWAAAGWIIGWLSTVKRWQ